MERNKSLTIEKLPKIVPDAASLRLQVTDSLLGGLRDARVGRSTLEQGDVLREVEAALEAYAGFFYPAEHR